MVAPATAPSNPPSERSLLIRYFLGAYGFTWALQLSIALLGLPYQSGAAQALYIISVLGPLLSAVVVSGTAAGRAGIRALFGQALRWRLHLWVYLAALLTVPVLRILSTLIYIGRGGEGPAAWLSGSPGGILFVLLSQFGYVMFAEEVGWRAFALPRLLGRFGAVGGTLVLACLHAAWHLPMFIVPGSNQYGTSFVAYLFTHLAWGMVMSFLYYRSGGSSLPSLLFHASLNAGAFLVAMPEGAYPYLRALYGLVILALVPLLPRPHFGRSA